MKVIAFFALEEVFFEKTAGMFSCLAYWFETKEETVTQKTMFGQFQFGKVFFGFVFKWNPPFRKN